MTRTTRPLTGRPSWPITMLAGVEKSGKTYAAVQASASDLVGRTFLIALGEDDPDEYGAIPGQRVEVVAHSGTYRDVLDALAWAQEQPADGPPNLLILDSGTRLWNLLCDQAQRTANERATRRAAKYGKATPADDVTISMDLWNLAAGRWAHVMDVLRAHQGPSIVTVRLDLVAVLDGKGSPVEGERRWKEQAHKSLPFDVGAIIHLREPATAGRPAPAVLRGVRSLRVKPDAGSDEATFEGGLTMDALWRGLGLADEPTGERTHAAVQTVADEDVPQEPRQETRQDPSGPPVELVARWTQRLAQAATHAYGTAERSDIVGEVWRAAGAPGLSAVIDVPEPWRPVVGSSRAMLGDLARCIVNDARITALPEATA